ncbi:DUF6461 domain-containing protein [Streptomyces sp. cmx-4-7]|uniref:DUF6461 domain-containing protein n=1 Tax=unclassified Streptomyces TaxID=2593676 RepID=UPI003980A763
MTKTGADYAWFEDDFPDIAEAYCFTLVRGLSPAELTSRLEGRPEAPLRGIAAVVDATFARYDLEEDRVLRLCFDPTFPEDRWGTAPDALLDVMRRIGFHFDDDDPERDLSSPAAFALAEHLTGVALTPALLQDTTFTCATVRIR